MEKFDKKLISNLVVVLLLVVVVFVLALLFAGKNGTGLDEGLSSTITKQAVINIGGNNLVAAVADTPLEREKGLAGRESLNDKMGMYFVFDESDSHSFWMKGMKIPLDIIWLNELNQVVYIQENVSPNTYPATFTPPVPAKYVLEVAAGYAKRNGVNIGDTIVVTELK